MNGHFRQILKSVDSPTPEKIRKEGDFLPEDEKAANGYAVHPSKSLSGVAGHSGARLIRLLFSAATQRSEIPDM